MRRIHYHYFNLVLIRFRKVIWGLINKSMATLWGVELGNKCTFDGKTYFRTLPTSRIVIGNYCRFNSSSISNLIGVHVPTIISTLKENALIEIGNGCGFSGTVISAAKLVRIGDDVKFGANALITDTDWHPEDFRSGEDKEIIIGSNVWIGYGVVILKGVKIGQNSLIGANSVVTKDIPPNVIAAGNPCEVIRKI